jgi:hypothetical protein
MDQLDERRARAIQSERKPLLPLTGINPVVPKDSHNHVTGHFSHAGQSLVHSSCSKVESDKLPTQQLFPVQARREGIRPTFSAGFQKPSWVGALGTFARILPNLRFGFCGMRRRISVVWGEEATQGGSTNEALNRSAQTAVKWFFGFDLGQKPGGRREAEPGDGGRRKCERRRLAALEEGSLFRVA